MSIMEFDQHQLNDDHGQKDELTDLELEKLLCNNPHPLLIPNIIDIVFHHLFEGTEVNRHVLDLRSCRLVCHRWEEIATKLYKKHSDDLVFGETNGCCDTEKMTKFLSQDNNNPSIIQAYKFDPGFFVQSNEALFKKFLYSCSSWIVTLKLWFDNKSTIRFHKRCFPDLKLESLQYLFFGCVNYRGTCSTEKMELTYLLDALVVSAINLKKFCFSFPPKKDSKSQQVLIKRFGDLISTKTPKTVKNLKLEMKLTEAQLEDLIKIGLSLEALHCDFRGSKLSSGNISKLLFQQQSTLQEMRLLDSETKYLYELTFPRFDKLTVLEIHGGTITQFSYKDNFPALERLLLFGWENNTCLSMLESTTPCETLKSLELPYKINLPNMIILTGKCFPNLKKLEITPTQDGMECLSKVFEVLDLLEELEITFPFIIEDQLNVDPCFTGISLEDCELLGCMDVRLFPTVNYKELQKSPSIANLSKLKKLSILDHSNEIKLTDVTAFFGLLKLQSLLVLELGRFNISSQVSNMLKNKVQLSENCESSDSCSDSSSSSIDSYDSDD